MEKTRFHGFDFLPQRQSRFLEASHNPLIINAYQAISTFR
nr:MAG TPA: hypothetical protein [Caudoviricetes sp.]